MLPSQGKRSKKTLKRKRTDDAAGPQTDSTDSTEPPRPQVEKHITIGLNSTTRSLEDSLQRSPANAEPQPTVDLNPSQAMQKDSAIPEKNLAAIVLTQDPDALPYRHLPTLSALVDRPRPSSPTLLVPLSAGSAEAKISAALGVPRVGVLGICDGAPGAEALLQYVRDNVPATVVPWIREAAAGKWLGTNVVSSGKDER